MRMEDEQFREAWPSVVRQLAAFAGSLDVGEELAAEAVARALEHERPIDDLVACAQRIALAAMRFCA